jgi:hypothetical protein
MSREFVLINAMGGEPDEVYRSFRVRQKWAYRQR